MHVGLATDAEEDPAFGDLFHREYASIVRTVVAITGSPETAEDVVQEAFVRAFARWRRVRRLDAPGAWVRRVAIRVAVRRHGRDVRRPELERVVEASTRTGGESTAAADRQLDVLSALATLPARQRAAVVLHHLDDRPVAEVAELLGCAPATVKVHLHRGRQRLGVLLDQEVDDVIP